MTLMTVISWPPSEKMVWGCVQQIVNSRKQQPETVEDVLAQQLQCMEPA